MCNTAARALIRRASVQPGTAKAQLHPIGPPNVLVNTHGISYEASRAGIVAAPATTAPYSTRPISQWCPRSRPASTASRSLLDLPHSLRSFHASSAAHKAKRKPEPQHSAGGSGDSSAGDADGESKHPKPTPEEPLNFADVESRLLKHAEHFKLALKKTHTGGRFDPDVVGALRVLVDKKAGTTYPLRELAQVVPRGGRTVSLLVHDAEYVKPIMSAVQGSPDFNQQPQRDADNELELLLKIEPEKPDDMAKKVKAVAHEWRDRIQAVRQKRGKLHDTWKKDGQIGPDLKRTADKELQKVIKDAIDEATNAEKSTVKAVSPN